MLQRIALAELYPNPDQPRKTFCPAKLGELAASIRQNGLKQPITARPDGAGRYMIVMGERRYRAHLLLEADAIQFGPLTSSVIPCGSSSLQDQEQAYLAALTDVHAWTYTEYGLKLRDEAGSTQVRVWNGDESIASA